MKPTATRRPDDETLADLLGGARGAIDATIPPVAFVIGWLASGELWVATVVALVVAASIALWQWRRGRRPRAVLLGVAGVAVAAMIALRTGRAEDFFVIQVAANAASALVWLVSIVFRRPLLGVVVGLVLRQRGAWRRDPALLRGYALASWVWVGQYVVRVAIFGPLWWSGDVVALAIARVALSWPLVALCLLVSWLVLQRSLPQEHPGIRHPQAA
ncbi:hypothetical protein J2S40_001208 [Nocardioides luteus]|uniref:DUF3159 domain-containing protein n=1 Tax=Nocardioides luteus TaxID=1844 RepID=A0ABQ5SS14_9ACTN|nr:DUF3159 domain-containing protein [Nocardioides luteus]MDR7310150.1 hypothetical protein [Nocardioides luteus]GGR74221.1 hypothetical protein GCM10010197_46830 [Nocardioides luteus]GLJ66943.1 hypothetical protein GCM10017579_09790 [Nocardioides luteus]